MESKKDILIELFFNEPTKPWHFEELCTSANLNRKQVLHWLCLFQKEQLIYRVKPRKKMPYYLGKYQSAAYQTQKRLFAIQKIHASGLLTYLQQLPQAQTIILFGSMARWDWHTHSDIDIFIYGEKIEINIGKYEISLGRDIQIFSCENKTQLHQIPPGLIKNIIAGDILKGNIDFIEL